MDSHPKKKKKNLYKANQKSNHGHVVGKDQYSLYSIQSKSKPNPITQYCNTDLFIKKKKNPIQRKPNPRPRANQTHGGAATACRRSSLRDLRRSSSSSSRRRSLARCCHSSLARHRRSSLARRHRSQIGLTVLAAPVLSLLFTLHKVSHAV